MTELGSKLNLKAVRLDVNAPALHEGYHARWDRGTADSEELVLWRADIPLTAGQQAIGRLEIVGYQDAEPVWMKIQTLSRMMQTFETTADLLVNGAWPDAAKASVLPFTLKSDRVPAG